MRLVMEHLSKQFKNRIAVESIDTELREGVYGFLGANGAGKTTLMQMICGIIVRWRIIMYMAECQYLIIWCFC